MGKNIIKEDCEEYHSDGTDFYQLNSASDNYKEMVYGLWLELWHYVKNRHFNGKVKLHEDNLKKIMPEDEIQKLYDLDSLNPEQAYLSFNVL